MKKSFYAGAAVIALTASGALADRHLAFGPDDARFDWDGYNAWAAGAPDLSGQTVTVSGPWLQPEDDAFRSVLAYFAEPV